MLLGEKFLCTNVACLLKIANKIYETSTADLRQLKMFSNAIYHHVARSRATLTACLFISRQLIFFVYICKLKMYAFILTVLLWFFFSSLFPLVFGRWFLLHVSHFCFLSIIKSAVKTNFPVSNVLQKKKKLASRAIRNTNMISLVCTCPVCVCVRVCLCIVLASSCLLKRNKNNAAHFNYIDTMKKPIILCSHELL